MNYKKLFLISILFFFVFVSYFSKVNANPMMGWAWSSTIGWISFNSSTNSYSNYGASYFVDISTTTSNQNIGIFSGYAWSPNIGWISFSPSAVLNCPVPYSSTKCQAEVNLQSGSVSGWARACSGFTNPSSCSGSSRMDGFDGWIELSGANHTSPNTDGVKMDKNTGAFDGFAWGSNVIGWVQFLASCPGCVGLQNTVDICPNINFNQSSLPSGMHLDSYGNCVSTGDICPNIDGIQSSLPAGMGTSPLNGYCVYLPPVIAGPPIAPVSSGKLWIGNSEANVLKQIRENQPITLNWNIGTWTDCLARIATHPQGILTIDGWTGITPSSLTTTATLSKMQAGEYQLDIICSAKSASTTNKVKIIVTDPKAGEL